jgi:type IV secretory pathway VirB9-like protein
MKYQLTYLCVFPLALLCNSLGSAQAVPKPLAPAKHPLSSVTKIDMAGAVTPDTPPAARVVQYSDRDVVAVNAKLHFTTMIILPKNEQIIDFTCGDKEFWIIDGNQNFAHVKPAKAGARTNLNLVTASGNVYSFMLAEVSEAPKAEVDVKLFVEPRDPSMQTAAGAAPKFVSAQAVDDYRRQVETAREEAKQAKQSAQTAIDSGISRFVSNVRFPYHFEAGKKPFFVRAMYHDDKFTYIQARPEETPTLYEIKDGKPNLVNFSYKDGVYVVDKILDQGYLAIGKRKLGFTREE